MVKSLFKNLSKLNGRFFCRMILLLIPTVKYKEDSGWYEFNFVNIILWFRAWGLYLKYYNKYNFKYVSWQKPFLTVDIKKKITKNDVYHELYFYESGGILDIVTRDGHGKEYDYDSENGRFQYIDYFKEESGD